MHPRQHASITALNAAGANTGHIVDVVVITADSVLLETLQDAVSTEHALWQAPSADAAVDLLIGGHCAILIADLQTIARSDAVALLERLESQFPELVLLATGRREEEGTVAGLISKGCVYRFLHKPVSPARANLFLATATRRYHELSNNVSPALATARQLTQPSNRIRLRVGAAAVTLLILGLVLIWSLRGTQSPQPASIATEEPATAQPTVTVENELAAARAAYAAGRWAAPPGDNALDHYRAALSVQADNAAALAGVQQVIDTLAAQVLQALQARDAPTAARALMTLQQVQPDHPQLDALRTQLLILSRNARPEASGATAKAPKPAEKPAATRSTPNVALARTRIASGQFIAPEGDGEQETAESGAAASQLLKDQLARAIKLRENGQLIEPAASNAYDALSFIAAANADVPEVRAEQQRLVFTLLESTRTALAAGELDRADALITRADRLLPGMTNTKTLLQQTAAAREERAASLRVVQAGELTRTREVPAAYPRDAQRDGTEGWVDVDFTIAPDGTTRELVVRDAEPKEVFDKAAVDALRRWRFEPIVRNGAPVAQRATLRVRFTPK